MSERLKSPKRAIELTLRISADSWNDVKNRLFDYETDLALHGQILAGTMGGPSCGDIREVELDPGMTHDRYFELLGKYLDELHAIEAAERQGEGG